MQGCILSTQRNQELCGQLEILDAAYAATDKHHSFYKNIEAQLFAIRLEDITDIELSQSYLKLAYKIKHHNSGDFETRRKALFCIGKVELLRSNLLREAHLADSRKKLETSLKVFAHYEAEANDGKGYHQMALIFANRADCEHVTMEIFASTEFTHDFNCWKGDSLNISSESLRQFLIEICFDKAIECRNQDAISGKIEFLLNSEGPERDLNKEKAKDLLKTLAQQGDLLAIATYLQHFCPWANSIIGETSVLERNADLMSSQQLIQFGRAFQELGLTQNVQAIFDMLLTRQDSLEEMKQEFPSHFELFHSFIIYAQQKEENHPLVTKMLYHCSTNGCNIGNYIQILTISQLIALADTYRENDKIEFMHACMEAMLERLASEETSLKPFCETESELSSHFLSHLFSQSKERIEGNVGMRCILFERAFLDRIKHTLSVGQMLMLTELYYEQENYDLARFLWNYTLQRSRESLETDDESEYLVNHFPFLAQAIASTITNVDFFYEAVADFSTDQLIVLATYYQGVGLQRYSEMCLDQALLQPNSAPIIHFCFTDVPELAPLLFKRLVHVKYPAHTKALFDVCEYTTIFHPYIDQLNTQELIDFAKLCFTIEELSLANYSLIKGLSRDKQFIYQMRIGCSPEEDQFVDYVHELALSLPNSPFILDIVPELRFIHAAAASNRGQRLPLIRQAIDILYTQFGFSE